MIGCDKFCTYCIVPSVRGPEQSRPPRAHRRRGPPAGRPRAARKSRCWARPSTATSTRRATAAAAACRDLLARIHDMAGIERIKFITNFPKDMTDDLLDAVRDLPKVCPYLHVPAQSGDNEQSEADETPLHGRILSRHAGAAAARGCPAWPSPATSSSASAARRRSSSSSTCDLVREAGSRTASSSSTARGRAPRPTSCIADDVPEEVKKRRNNDLLAIQNKVSLADHRGRIGQTVAGPGRGAEQERAQAARRVAAHAAHRADHDRSHRRLRREPASDGSNGGRGRWRMRRRSRCSAAWSPGNRSALAELGCRWCDRW